MRSEKSGQGLEGSRGPEILTAPSVGVLIQDPHLLVRDCLRLVIEQLDGAQVIAEAARPDEALEVARRTHPDIVMIDLDNLAQAIPVIKRIAAETPNVKVICLAEEAGSETVDAALQAGASGLALKSESVEDLLRALNVVRNGQPTIAPNAAGPLLRHYIRVVREKGQRDAAVIQTLASAVEAKDRYTGGHTQRVAALALKIAHQMDPAMAGNEQLRYGFMLHDVGKIGVPEEILRKRSALTTQEWEVMKTHPLIGLQIIGPVGLGPDVENVVRHHHERWDGGGYPDGLAGDEIPLGPRLFAVADAFDAMTSDRPYRRATAARPAIKEIEAQSGRQFDPEAVECFRAVAAS